MSESASPTSPTAERREEIARWRRELRDLRHRYGTPGDIPELAQVDRLEASGNRKQRDIARLRRQVADLEAEIHDLEQEVRGREAGLALLLPDIISRIRQRFFEAWSPVPVLGYRYWEVTPKGLAGFRQLWNRPILEAVCETTRDSHEVPHSDGRCGRLGCGIYAAKRMEDLGLPAINGLAVGLVALTGKVVEHTKGYRGARAEVVAVGVGLGNRLLVTDDPAVIAALFAGPPGKVSSRLDEAAGPALPFLADYLGTRARRISWT